MIWDEFNENRVLKKIIKDYNQCLLNIVKTHIFNEMIKT